MVGQSSTGRRRMRSKPNRVQHQSAQPSVVSGRVKLLRSDLQYLRVRVKAYAMADGESVE